MSQQQALLPRIMEDEYTKQVRKIEQLEAKCGRLQRIWEQADTELAKLKAKEIFESAKEELAAARERESSLRQTLLQQFPSSGMRSKFKDAMLSLCFALVHGSVSQLQERQSSKLKFISSRLPSFQHAGIAQRR